MWSAFEFAVENILERIAQLPRPLRSSALGAITGIALLWFWILARAGGLIGAAVITLIAVFSFGWKGLLILPGAALVIMPGGAVAGIVYTLLAPLRANTVGRILVASLAVASYFEVTIFIVWRFVTPDAMPFDDPTTQFTVAVMSVPFGVMVAIGLKELDEDDDLIDWEELRTPTIDEQINEAVAADLAELRERATVSPRYELDLQLISRNEPSAQLVMHWWRVRRRLVPAYGPAFGRSGAAVRHVERRLAHERRRWASELESRSPQQAA